MRRQVEAKTIVGVSSKGDSGEYPNRGEKIRPIARHCPIFTYLLMSNQPTSEIELLRMAYAAFNARDTNAVLAIMTPDVTWPRAFKGGFVHGPEEVRAYWTEQWSEIDAHVEPVAFHPEEGGRILVDVHQVVRNLAGTVLADEHVGHCFTIEHGLIQAMEVCPLPSGSSDA